MNIIKMLYEVWCSSLIASHLTRRGKWQSAVRLMNK